MTEMFTDSSAAAAAAGLSAVSGACSRLSLSHTQLTRSGITAARYFRSRQDSSWCSTLDPRRNLLILPLRLRVVRMQSPRHKSALFPYFSAKMASVVTGRSPPHARRSSAELLGRAGRGPPRLPTG